MVDETTMPEGKEAGRVLSVRVTGRLHERFRMLSRRKGYGKPTEFIRSLMQRELDANESKEVGVA